MSDKNEPEASPESTKRASVKPPTVESKQARGKPASEPTRPAASSTLRQVTHVRRDRQGRLLSVANPESTWKERGLLEVIADIESGQLSYVVKVEGHPEAALQVEQGPEGRYLRSEGDASKENNLDNLPMLERSPEHASTPSMPPAPTPVDIRIDQAHDIVQRHVYWAMAAGVLPLPLFDVLALTGVHLKLVLALSKHYGHGYREDLARKAITSLLMGVGGIGVGGLIGASLVKSIPVIGQSLGIVSVPAIAGALTHALGRTFVMHFEAGGTLLDFDVKAMRAYFEREFSSRPVPAEQSSSRPVPAEQSSSRPVPAEQSSSAGASASQPVR